MMHFMSVAVIVAIAAASAPAHATDRAPASKASKSKSAPHRAAPTDRVYDDRDANSWYPRDTNKLKFGSRIWWDQMEAEGRLSRPENN
jgi:hypothetical protein